MTALRPARGDPLRLAWLLRANLRRGESPDAPLTDWYRCWWAINGRREYPAWAHLVNVQSLKLMQPLPDWPSFGQFGMTAALHFLFEQRKDLRQHFDVTTESGLWHAIAWMYVHGLKEHRLEDLVDEPIRAALDETPPFLHWPLSQTPMPQPVTWLMFFVWRCYPDLQKSFDLLTAKGQLEYLEWFFLQGVAQLGLAPLLTDRWRSWLQRPLPVKDRGGLAIPRAVLLLAQKRLDLQLALDQRTAADAQAWAASVMRAETQLRWLLTVPATPQKAVSRGALRPDPLRKRAWGVNLIGFAFGELGIGEDVRMAVAACEAADIPFKVVNINPGTHLRQADRTLAAHVTAYADKESLEERAPYAVNVFCLTGFDTARAYLEQGSALFDGRYNIGWWPWELPVWPQHWVAAFDLVDEVWAATTFTQKMYTAAQQGRARRTLPVRQMPLPVSVQRLQPRTRRALGLSEKRFLFLYVFDFNSYLARKNPWAALAAFARAFPRGDDSVGLVIKTMNSRADNPQWMQFVHACAADPRIVLLDRMMDRGEVLGLVQACDVYLSLHRAEGFGRTLAEAMLLGKPVVGTDFSGNRDFLDDSNGFPVRWKRCAVKPGEYPFITAQDRAWWADPDIDHAASQMHQALTAAQDVAWLSAMQQRADKQFAPRRIGELMRARLRELAAMSGYKR